MTEDQTQPNTVQVTAWRNLLDAFAQLSAAWQAAVEAERRTEDDEPGPGAFEMPESLVKSFARAGEETAQVLTGVAAVLSQQRTAPSGFPEITQAQRTALGQWREAHALFNEDS